MTHLSSIGAVVAVVDEQIVELLVVALLAVVAIPPAARAVFAAVLLVHGAAEPVELLQRQATLLAHGRGVASRLRVLGLL